MKTEAIRGDWAGQVIDGRFTLLQWLGGSDASGVFLTQLQGDQPQKAVIRLIPADAIDADAQIAQWQAATSLSHPHLMRLLYTGRCQIGGDPLLYAVTEYAEENLSEILPERPLTPAEAREMLDPILDALGYLHSKGFVHGHLKPSNIMVVNDLVKLSSDNIQVAGKLSKLVPATGAHDAPECAGGTISPAADVWSLGATLVEALTQRPPVWERATQNDPVVPESIPQPFAGIARESLRSDPARRCTLSDVRDRLHASPSLQRPAGKSDRAAPARLRGPMIAAATLVAIAVIAVFLARSHQSPSSPPAREQQTEPAIAAPKTQSPVPETHASKGATLKGEVAERVLPDVLPSASATIHGQVNVKIRITVDATGAVSSADFDSPGPSKYFAKAAMQAAQRWRFKPAHVKGQAVSSVWMLQFQFKQSGTEVNAVEVSPRV
ncbi:MAG: TonB family protein [Terracidiphilus sp.]|jgi:serine/threonine-protein kinase